MPTGPAETKTSNPRRISFSLAARVALALVAVATFSLTIVSGATRATAHEMQSQGTEPSTPKNDSFMSMMDEAMRRMDAGMNVKPTNDPDRDFARMMIPHHQGAVDMALAELRFGKDERLRRLAQGIIVEQRQEIALMQSILDGPPPPAEHPATR